MSGSKKEFRQRAMFWVLELAYVIFGIICALGIVTLLAVVIVL